VGAKSAFQSTVTTTPSGISTNWPIKARLVYPYGSTCGRSLLARHERAGNEWHHERDAVRGTQHLGQVDAELEIVEQCFQDIRASAVAHLLDQIAFAILLSCWLVGRDIFS